MIESYSSLNLQKNQKGADCRLVPSCYSVTHYVTVFLLCFFFFLAVSSTSFQDAVDDFFGQGERPKKLISAESLV